MRPPKAEISPEGTTVAAGGNTRRDARRWARLVRSSLITVSVCSAGTVVNATDADEIVAVFATVNPDYRRETTVGGKFRSETYAFGEGGQHTRAGADSSVDHLPFLTIAQTISPALAAQGYLPCDKTDPTKVDLLIMVYWGGTPGTDTTSGSAEYQLGHALIPAPAAPPPPPPTGAVDQAMVSDPMTSGRAQAAQSAEAIKRAADSALEQSLFLTSMANRRRDRQNIDNGVLLGYGLELANTAGGIAGTPFAQRRQDLIDEISDSRYYVVLLAYDFQRLRNQRERKILWEIRFSIRQRHHHFDEQLASMAAAASRYFGQNSDGVKRRRIGNEQVKLGEMQILGVDLPSK